MRRRLHEREHDDDLIHVRRDDALAATGTGLSPRQLGSARMNLADNERVTPLDALQLDVVADGELEPALLDASADRAFIRHAVRAEYSPDTASAGQGSSAH